MCYGSAYSTQNDDIRSDNMVFYNITYGNNVNCFDCRRNGLHRTSRYITLDDRPVHFDGSLLRKPYVKQYRDHYPFSLRHNQIKYFLKPETIEIEINFNYSLACVCVYFRPFPIWLLIISIYNNYDGVYCMPFF